MPDTTVSIAVTLPQPSLQVGATTQAAADVRTTVTDGSLDTKAIAWSSSAPTVATVDANGLVRAVAAGSSVIRAAIGTVAGTATVTVAMPVVAITAAQAAAIGAFPLGTVFKLRDPSVPPVEFTVQVSA